VLQRIVRRCQILVGQIGPIDSSFMISELRVVLATIPAAISVPQRLVVCGLLGQVLSRFVCQEGIDTEPNVAAAFVVLARFSSSDEWRAGLERLLDCCAASRENAGGRVIPFDDVRRAFAFIESHYTESRLTLKQFATAIHRSPSHLSRLLQRHTGTGFISHVRHRRILAARRLLSHSSWSVKAIAAAVGYEGATSFGRQFRQECGVTPKSFQLGSFVNPTI
jgi:AraC-like DNA-binding protein